jgi:hypothetical protein
LLADHRVEREGTRGHLKRRLVRAHFGLGRVWTQEGMHVESTCCQHRSKVETQNSLRSSLPDLRARLQVSFIRTHFPSPWHEGVHVPYVQANLLAVKQGPRLGGPLMS